MAQHPKLAWLNSDTNRIDAKQSERYRYCKGTPYGLKHQALSSELKLKIYVWFQCKNQALGDRLLMRLGQRWEHNLVDQGREKRGKICGKMVEGGDKV